MDSTIDHGQPDQHRVAAGALLDTWTTYDWSAGIRVDRLAPLDRLTIRTRHSTYELVVTTPATAEVMVRGGAFFHEFTPVHVAGSSLGGSFLKLHTIHAGFRLELADDTRVIVTSPVQDISLTTTGAASSAPSVM